MSSKVNHANLFDYVVRSAWPTFWLLLVVGEALCPDDTILPFFKLSLVGVRRSKRNLALQQIVSDPLSGAPS